MRLGVIELVILALAARGEVRPRDIQRVLCDAGACSGLEYNKIWIAARSLARRGFITWRRDGRAKLILVTDKGLEALKRYAPICKIVSEANTKT